MSTNKPFNLIFKCGDCNEYFPISGDKAPNSLNHKKEFISNGQSIFLTYYDCPHCGRRHFVQIDDAHSLNELKSVTDEFYKLAAMRKKGKTISKKQSDKFQKSRQHLSEYRKNLMKVYTDKIAINEAGIEYVLRFTET